MKKIVFITAFAMILSVFTGCTVKIKEEIKNPVEDIYVISSTERLYIDERPRVTGQGNLSVSMAKNESEGAQFVVRSEQNEYKNLAINISDLKTDNGAVIPATSVKLYREYFTTATYRWGMPPLKGDTAATLIPTANVLIPMWYPDLNTVNTKVGENTIYYIDVTSEKETEAGIYNGVVSVAHDSGKFEIPITVRVYDVTLPETPTYRTLFNYSSGFLMTYLNNKGHPEYYEKAMQNAFELMSEFKLSSTSVTYPEIIGSWKTQEEQIANIAAYMEKTPTFTAFAGHLQYSMDENNEAYMTEQQKQYNLNYVSLLEKYGILDNMYNYVVDEPGEKWQFSIMNLMGDFLKENGLNEKVHNLVTKDSFQSVKGSTNTWCPIVSNFNPEYADEIRAKEGCEYWWYFCNEPPAPGISMFNDISNTRMHGWMAKNWDIKGILYWAMNLYAIYYDGAYDNNVNIWNCGTNDPLLLQGLEGDGILNRNICAPTLALIGVRDGVEDFDLLVQLEKSVESKINELNLDMNVQTAMEGYYNSMYLSLNEFPTYEAPDNILMMREHVFSDITNGVGYIMNQHTLSANGKYNVKEIDIYVAHGEKVSFNNSTLINVTKGDKFDIYKYSYLNSEFSDTIDITVNENLYTRPIIATKTINSSALLLNLEKDNAIELLKQANPKYADRISIISKDGTYTLKVDFTSEMTYINIPAQLFTNVDLSQYNRICFNVSIESSEILGVSFSGSVGTSVTTCNSKTIYNAKPITVSSEISVTEPNSEIGNFRLGFNKKTSATMYFSNAYVVSADDYKSETELRYQ